LGDAGEFEQIHLAQTLHESHDLARKGLGGFRGLSLEDLEFPCGVRIVHPEVEAATLDGGVDLASAVGSEHDDRRLRGSHRADLGLADAGLAFEKQRAVHLEGEEYRGGEAALGDIVSACEQGESVVDRLGKRAHTRIMPAWPAKNLPRQGRSTYGSPSGV